LRSLRLLRTLLCTFCVACVICVKKEATVLRCVEWRPGFIGLLYRVNRSRHGVFVAEPVMGNLQMKSHVVIVKLLIK